MTRSCRLAFVLLSALLAGGCASSSPDLSIDIARHGAARIDVEFQIPPVGSEAVIDKKHISNGTDHDRLELRTKVPLRVRVIIEPIDAAAAAAPTAPMPGSQPAMPGRRAEP